jgi:hypothetical protein
LYKCASKGVDVGSSKEMVKGEKGVQKKKMKGCKEYRIQNTSSSLMRRNRFMNFLGILAVS